MTTTKANPAPAERPGPIRRRLDGMRVVHNIPPGHHLGGPRITQTMLLLFGPALVRELDERALLAFGPPAPAKRKRTRRPRR